MAAAGAASDVDGVVVWWDETRVAAYGCGDRLTYLHEEGAERPVLFGGQESIPNSLSWSELGDEGG